VSFDIIYLKYGYVERAVFGLVGSGFRQHPAARDAIALSNRNALVRK
jgi:hypothetical protein